MPKAKKDETFNTEFRERYTVDKNVRTPSGAYSVSNRDDVAKALNGLTIEQLERIAARAGLGDRFKKWSHLNPGMQRMNLGNVFRGAVEGEDAAKAKAALVEAKKLTRTAKPAATKKKGKAVKRKASKKAAPVAVEAVTATS
jgi:sRNA-binding protein